MTRTIAAAALLAAATSALAAVKTKEVEYKHGDVTLKGYFAYDDAATGKRPGVLVAPEWWGNNAYSKKRAEMLAELGYVALAIDMYGGGKTVETGEEAQKLAGPFQSDRTLMRERAGAGLKALAEQPNVDASKLAAIGYCFGGTIALELARSGADLDAAVSFHGGLKTPDATDAKKIKGSVMVCNGDADTFVPAAEREAFHKEMRDAKVDYVYIDYAGAVHAFTNPDADKKGMKGVAYNEKADKRSWEHMKAFLAEAFKR